jgi:dihydropteroate synthase
VNRKSGKSLFPFSFLISGSPIFSFKNNKLLLMFTLNCKGRLLLVDKPIVMGIINVTPDSFYAGSRHTAEESLLNQVEQMLKEGATILDIGGQSTRPGSKKITIEDELQRVIPAITAVSKRFPLAFISVDTYYARVATEAVAAGASIINDISAGNLDDAMIPTVAALKVPYVLMHMKGTPQTMQQEADYLDVSREVLDFFIHKLSLLKEAGIHDIIIDPGFGFAKNSAQNFELLKNLEIFNILNAPVLLGVSRKSFIWKTLGITPDEALNGTTVMNTIGLQKGASILRVHDVKPAMEAIDLYARLKSK